ncbi:MAG: hypothetical protein ABSD59_00600 [Terracidiphilus sp.]|jgi:hypothetical protein
MHFNFDFSTAQVLWTLTFAALLVLLVVLLGRDRVRRFPWFTTSMALTALRMLAGRLLFHRMAPTVLEVIFLVLADLASIVSLLVVVEIARQAFAGAGRREWIVATLALLVVGGVVLAMWGAWPSFKTLFASSELSAMRVMELFAQKTDLLSDVLIIQLGLLVVIFGRYFKAGWHSHTQQLAIGLAMASIAQLTIRGTLQNIAMHTVIHSQNDYKRVMGVMNSLNNADSIIFLVALVWWIVCLWIDEPGSKTLADSEQQTLDSSD